MDRWKREMLLSANNGLRGQVEHLLDTYERQHDRLAETYRQLEAMRVQACSPDRSVEVTVDSSGVLAELELTASALRKSPEALARTIIDAVQEAARHAREQQRSLTASSTEELGDMDDLPDIMPGVPGLDGIRAYLRGEESRTD
ncbi:YbaB/EbfC family nucleoid-associated protein [Nocardia jinanensis]|nr:YbaB/EbfC family nucleoid-associated protein [Nocardia jinanensis]